MAYQLEEIEIVYGIQKFVTNNDVGIVVLGNRGENLIKETLFGNTALEAMKNLSCPVLAIPKGVVYKKPKHLLYAADIDKSDVEITAQLVALAKGFDATVYLAHHFEEENMILQQDANEFKRALKERVQYAKLKTTSQTYGDLIEYIDKEIIRLEADWLVMHERKHNLFYELFHQDVVKKFMYHSQIPLLVYNDHCIRIDS